jgi:hypothetical protein
LHGSSSVNASLNSQYTKNIFDGRKDPQIS